MKIIFSVVVMSILGIAALTTLECMCKTSIEPIDAAEHRQTNED